MTSEWPNMNIWLIFRIVPPLPTTGQPNASCVSEKISTKEKFYYLDVNMSQMVDNYALGCIIFEMATGMR